ncbi:MAG TPA: hypothetical protein VKB09_12485 [Thermomicrobiales bacterium]|nr:hypothetical protein [Thermomicrobiales bacterium]
MADPRDEAAIRFEAIADELECAAAHCRSVAAHFRERAVPRAAAHAFAARGHLVTACAALDAEATDFARRAVPYVPDQWVDG